MADQIADTFELSPQQERLWLAEPDGPAGRVQATISLTGPLDQTALHAALRRTVERHEILRTTFVHRPGIRVPVQAVSAELLPAWSEVDLSELEGDGQRRRVKQLADDALGEDIDFASGPLTHAVLLKLSDVHHTLLVTLSALCADPSSAPLLARELLYHYAGAGSLVDDPLQYADFSAWHRELGGAEDEEAVRGREFWARAKEAAPTALPFGGSGKQSHSASAAAEVPVTLDAALRSRLADAANRYGASVSSVVLAAWQVVLARSSGEDEVTVALLGAQRRHSDLEGALGVFSRQVPIRARIGTGVSFAELLQEVDHAALEASVWQDYAPVDAPTPPVAFVQVDASRIRAGELEAELERVIFTEPGVGVWLTAVGGQDELALELQYDSRLLSPEGAELLARRLGRLLRSIAEDLGGQIDALELLDRDERHLLLVEFNRSGDATDGPAVHERFGAHAAAQPESEAVVDEHGPITYGELERRANQLANRLRRAGAGPDVTVGLCTDRSVDMVVALLGILKAGGAYLPLHYEHPPARLAHQLSTAGARAVVTQEPLLGHLPEFEGEVICLDRDRADLDREDCSAPEVSVAAQNLAYVIYTSGSTGAPKGVGVTHGNLANYASYIVGRLGADAERMSFGVVTSISTDLGNTSIFGALCSGGKLVLVSPLAAADASAFVRQVKGNPIDVLKITPSHIGALIAGLESRVLPRRWLVIGGERAPWDLIARVRTISDCRILNHYGPTEATIGCCTFTVDEGAGDWEPATVPIGRPIAGASCYVLDERREPVPLGAPGQLHVGGACVARGYVGAPELTAERFLDDPFASTEALERSGTHSRMYDTGDLARWLPDGTLEFLGRSDEQVKVRGYRVEPAEVESALRRHPEVREAVVAGRPGPAGDIRLIAYCTTSVGLGKDELAAHLAGWLPEFMLPSAIVKLESLPMTPSGKVDRLALPDPDEDADPTAQYVAPRTPVEEAIAEIWAHVLGVDRVGVRDDFFALGGHSLLATQVVAQVRSDLALELPLHSLFTYPTVESLAAEIVQMMGDSEEDTASLMAELAGLSDEEAERLLAGEPPDA